MPQFNLTDQEVNDLADFLEWVSKTNTQNWPPNQAG
jgi:nitric oxide reductase subunit C